MEPLRIRVKTEQPQPLMSHKAVLVIQILTVQLEALAIYMSMKAQGIFMYMMVPLG